MTKSPNDTFRFGRVCVLLAVSLASMVSGCAGYQLGNKSLFRNDVRTVHVPVIRNDSYRDDLGVRLTEALQKAIEVRTPYKVSSDPGADSVLTCRVIGDSKTVLTETDTDEQRALDNRVSIQVSWLDRQGRLLLNNRILPPNQLALYFQEGSRLVPEGGQSSATAFQESIDDLAQQIVSQMEVRW